MNKSRKRDNTPRSFCQFPFLFFIIGGRLRENSKQKRSITRIAGRQVGPQMDLSGGRFDNARARQRRVSQQTNSPEKKKGLSIKRDQTKYAPRYTGPRVFVYRCPHWAIVLWTKPACNRGSPGFCASGDVWLLSRGLGPAHVAIVPFSSRAGFWRHTTRPTAPSPMPYGHRSAVSRAAHPNGQSPTLFFPSIKRDSIKEKGKTERTRGCLFACRRQKAKRGGVMVKRNEGNDDEDRAFFCCFWRQTMSPARDQTPPARPPQGVRQKKAQAA